MQSEPNSDEWGLLGWAEPARWPERLALDDDSRSSFSATSPNSHGWSWSSTELPEEQAPAVEDEDVFETLPPSITVELPSPHDGLYLLEKETLEAPPTVEFVRLATNCLTVQTADLRLGFLNQDLIRRSFIITNPLGEKEYACFVNSCGKRYRYAPFPAVPLRPELRKGGTFLGGS